jgi:hypothetical protein
MKMRLDMPVTVGYVDLEWGPAGCTVELLSPDGFFLYAFAQTAHPLSIPEAPESDADVLRRVADDLDGGDRSWDDS